MVLSTGPLSTRHEVRDERAAQDFFHEKGWTDGLPVIPPTPERVLACLDQAVLAPDQVIGIEPVRARPITAEKAAVNAAQRTLDFSMALYKQGATDYLTVVTSQTALLQTQLQALNLDTLQLTASVDLIRALGGGWESPSAPAAAASDTRERLHAHGT